MAAQKKKKRAEKLARALVEGKSKAAAAREVGIMPQQVNQELKTWTGQDQLGKALEAAGATKEFIASKLVDGAIRGETGPQLEYLDRIIKLRRLIDEPKERDRGNGPVNVLLAIQTQLQANGGIIQEDGKVLPIDSIAEPANRSDEESADIF